MVKMKNITTESCFLRLKESLTSKNKIALIDKSGQYTQKEAFDIYCGIMNHIKNIVKRGTVCLIAPFIKKETPLIISAIVSLGGIVIIGNPKETKDSFIAQTSRFTKIDVLVHFHKKWCFEKRGKTVVLELKREKLKVSPFLRASKTRPSFYFYTAGSTGHQRIVALSEYSLFNNIVRQKQDTGDSSSIGYLCLPLHHIFGVAAQLQYLVLGKTAYVSDTRNPDVALDIIEKYRCTTIANVPAFYYMLIDKQNKNKRNIASLKYGVIAGGSYSSEQYCFIQDQLNISLCSSYGMTEASTGITNNSHENDTFIKSKGVGKPLEGTEVVFKDENNAINHCEGEICFKGFNLMLGYVTKDGLELPLDKDGYFHTGDLGKIDEDGIIHIVGRKKNIIIRGGENISCEALEQKIMKIPYIKDVCVVGIEDEKYGEIVGAYVASDCYQDEKELLTIINNHLLKSEMVSIIAISERVPLLPTNKHDNTAIKKMLTAKHSKEMKI